MTKINAIIWAARTFLGTSEGSTAHKEIIRRYNSAKNSSAYTMTVNDPWCAAFIVAVFEMCGFSNLIPCYASCEQMISAFKKWGRFVTSKSYSPKEGDIVFYNWDSDKKSDHVGLVTKNSFGTMTVIEGNYKNSVGYRTISVGNSSIVGYGTPAYESESGTNSTVSYFKLLGKYDAGCVQKFPCISKGSKGTYVKILQLLLRVHQGSNLDIDGDFGNKTELALIKWQRSMSLDDDGVCGVESWSSFFVTNTI